MKTVEAKCVTSSEIKRKKISFDESSGLIREVSSADGNADYLFGDDCLLFAGIGDVHIHAREDVSGKNNYKEDFLSARAAMHNGGVTHAGDMPNNPIPPVSEESYESKLLLAEKTQGEIWIYAGIGPGTSPLHYPVPYKVYMGPSVGELYFKDLATLDEALSRYQGQSVSFHCEDPEILSECQNEPHHGLRRPVSAEVVATRDALYLIEKYQLKGKLCHYSSEQGLSLVRQARARGVQVALEVTPQHLYFSSDNLSEDQKVSFQMNPPLRSEHDRLAMLSAYKNGEIDFLATDHAPHTPEEKAKGTSGLTGLDTLGPFITWLIQEGVDPKLIAKTAVENPGRFHNQFLDSWKEISKCFKSMGKGLGFLDSGYRANFTILNLNKPLIISQKNLKTKAASSPFLDVHFPGQVEALFIGGQKV